MLSDRVLVVCAHPDDEILGCGGVLAKLRKRDAAVRVLFLGEGSSCRFDRASRSGAECSVAIADRQNNARAALARIGIEEVIFQDAICGQFNTIPLIDLGRSIEAEISAFRPQTVLTHSHVDANNDHRISFQATLQATRPGALNHVALVLSFEVLSSTEWRFVETFQPNYFVSIEDEIDAKIEAMSFYATETRPFPFARSAENIRALAMMRGAQAGLPFAEAFHIVRAIAP
jgi:LmbE family N-acetylglucosaminyl deacetylase